MHPNVSICQSIAASCFDWSGKRNKIVSEAADFPSNLYILQRLEDLGGQLVTALLDGLLKWIDERLSLSPSRT